MSYTVEPTDHWRAGDRAYCVRGIKKDGRHVLEAGRVYSVVDAWQIKGVMSDGLRLDGPDPGDAQGFWSHHFACIRGPEPAMKQLARRIRRGWLEAYEECRDARKPSHHSGEGE